MFHEAVNADIGIIDQSLESGNDLSHVVRRNFCSNADSYARAAIYQKVREARGEHCGFLLGSVKGGER